VIAAASRLVDDAKDIHAGNRSSVLNCPTLRIVEISRNRNDGIVDRSARVSFSSPSDSTKPLTKSLPETSARRQDICKNSQDNETLTNSFCSPGYSTLI